MKRENQDRENQAIVLALLRSQQMFMRAMGPTFRDGGLTAPQWDALEVLSHKGALSINDLMHFTLSTSGSLDVVLQNLIQAGWVEKSVNEFDKRARVLRLTPAGREKVADFLPVHNRALDRVFEKLSAHDKRTTISKLNQFRKKLSQARKD